MARVVHFEIDQAASFEKELQALDKNGNPINLTGYTLRAQAKPSFVTFVAHTFTITVTDAVEGKFTLSLTDIQTRDMSPGRMLYDVKATSSSGVTTRTHEGIIQVNPTITDANPFVSLQGTKITDPRIVHVHENKDVLDRIVSIGQVGTLWKVITEDRTVENGDRLFIDASGSPESDIILYVDPFGSPETVENNFTLTIADIGETITPTSRVIIRTTDETSPPTDLFIIEGSGFVQIVYITGSGWKMSIAVPFGGLVV